MNCCGENINNLGCFDSCQKIKINVGSGSFGPNELYIKYYFNGAIVKRLITEVDENGKPIIDLSQFNENYTTEFSIHYVTNDTLIGCYNIKVIPCESVYNNEQPITQYINTETQCIDYECFGDIININFNIDISNITGIKNGTEFNIWFTLNIPTTNIELVSITNGVTVIDDTKFMINNVGAISNVIEMTIKINGCLDNIISIGVIEINNLVSGWGNGEHIPQNNYKIIF